MNAPTTGPNTVPEAARSHHEDHLAGHRPVDVGQGREAERQGFRRPGEARGKVAEARTRGSL